MTLDVLTNTNTLVGIGAIIFAISFTYAQFRSGSSRSSLELIQIYKDQISAQDKVIKDLQAQVNSMRQEIGKLQGLHEANEKKIKEYMDLLGPSGELKTTLADLVKSTKTVDRAEEFMTNFPTIIAEAIKGTKLTADIKADVKQ